MPNFFGQIADAMDDTRRVSYETLTDRFKAKIPVLRETLKAQTDIQGNPMRNPGYLNLTPFMILDSGDPLALTFIKNDVPFDMGAKRSLEGVPADQAQYLLQERYQMIEDALDQLPEDLRTEENIRGAAEWATRKWGEKAKSAEEYYAAEAAKEAESAE
jgi:hypothetical protein